MKLIFCKYILIGICFIYIIPSFSQDKNCKVIKIGIEETYEGECKRGLANGNGKATGELGTYVGLFKKGMPNGLGKLTYSNDHYYEGKWKYGKKHGEGVLVYPADSTVRGFWEEDVYIGEYPSPYKIVSQYGSAKISIRKVNDTGDNIEIIFIRNGMKTQQDVVQLMTQNSSGVLQEGQFLGFQNVVYPFDGRIECQVKNLMHTSNNIISLVYKIYEKGKWQVVINY
ncbi:MAG: hypothetical protein OEW67_02175 [Cyclobacteriaceae bacterium]|nr:hypothetical protein [Cyclobacteriaceae bacterium]